jgi:phospholipid/cholesterol/gamma-HCH transport system ATP-binding protein
MSDQSPAIEFRNVSISFDDKPALDDVSFRLERGRMICITGVSRSGMSVLLQLAAGLLRPDVGQIFVDGREIEVLDEQELLALRSATLGMVFQEQALFTGMSVYDNTAYRLDEHNWPEDDTERAVSEILTFVGLEEDIDKLPEELSIGMRRRLEFARAMVGWPEIMLFDEATSGLDPLNARAILDLVIRARDIHNISSLYVTKELHEIPYLAHQCAVEEPSGGVSIRSINDVRGERSRLEIVEKVSVMVLEAGRVVFSGKPSEFESSDLPAVIRLTHPASSAPSSETYIPDPWSHSKKRDE